MTQHDTTIVWRDPAEALAALPGLSGIEFMKRVASGELPGAPIASHFAMDVLEVGPGTVTFRCRPDASHYNPIGTVHGGLVCTLLDSALGCATHTTLPAGTGYTSIEIKVNYLRPVTVDSGPLICAGRVTKPGSRVAFAEGEVVDSHGKVVASASGSLLIFPLQKS
ncbi:MAG TPA: PaaI family thioesterase [Mycobacterium sp.]|uniref:PaaI family thioesterase n=1 Tax=Mycolicibacterium sp. TaxID=2320850 RepID=UPI0025D6AB5E|nr:PaaI family thioesterase [Mycolicibacterium sp.]HPX36571.1 PaaI family thioesterase [Mycobacterium sp.]HQC76815.1 PaaI family thioesterase [Mycobacterium sp.]